jgi:hypothetical protein
LEETVMTRENRPANAGHRFAAGGRTIVAGRTERIWTLTVDEQMVITRDLSGGVDELLGRSGANLALVLRILEAEAKSTGTDN